MAAEREPGLDLEPRSGPGRERADGRHAPAADEDGSREARLDGGGDEAAGRPAQALEAAKVGDDPLERLDAVLHPARVLVAERSGERTHLRAQSREGKRGVGELRLARALERAGCEPGARPRADRPERPRLRRADQPGAAAPQGDVAVGPRAARVPRWPELADQAELL